MELKDKKTVLEWNDAYLSPQKRLEGIYCANCGGKMFDSDSACIGSKNGSNMYECSQCKQIQLIWFKDLPEEQDIKLRFTKKQLKLIFIIKIAVLVGICLGWVLTNIISGMKQLGVL